MKKTTRESFRVEVNPDIRYLINPKEEYVENICNSIKTQIMRHVDECGSVRVVWDTLTTCEHCGFEWELDEEGIPTCCNKAIDELKEDK